MKIKLIRKEAFKEYFFPLIVYGPLLGLVFFLGMLSKYGFKTAFLKGFPLGVLLGFGIQFIGFIIMEIIVRRNQIKNLQGDNFRVLESYGIYLNDNLFFEGKFKEYSLKIYPHEEQVSKTKKRLYFMIQSYYKYPSSIDKKMQFDFDMKNCMQHESGTIQFGNHTVSMKPKNQYNPNFSESIKSLIEVLSRLDLKPMNFEEWDEKIMTGIREMQKKDEESRTMQILKLGKFDIKYRKASR